MLLAYDGRYIPAQCYAKPESASPAHPTEQSEKNRQG